VKGRSRRVGIGALALVWAAGCGRPPPPKELAQAREIYERAEDGIAEELAPAELDTAKKALQLAERTYRDDGDEIDTRALAYVAERRALLAEAVAGELQAKRDKDKIEKLIKEQTEAELAKARDAIRAERERLEKEKRAREDADKARLKAEEDRARAEKDKASADKARTEAELARAKADKERDEAERARKEAERIAAEALEKMKQMGAKEEARGVVITLSGQVLFTSGKSDLLPMAREKLDEVAKVLKEQNNPPLLIEGHTDSAGSASDNRKLGQARADAVRSHLVSRGYPESKIRAVGIGADRPIAPNSSPEGRANNRRVEIVVNPR
jgi:outer membrane protein OmpA-like peptidoglycan-associated protein